MYASLDDLKRELFGSVNSNADDDVLLSRLKEATRLVDGYTKRRFAVSTASTIRVDCSDEYVLGKVMTLPRDCHTITNIINGDGTVVQVGQFSTKPKSRDETLPTGDEFGLVTVAEPDMWPFYQLILKRNYSWTWSDDPLDAISITAKWGFSETPPEDIAGATLSLAAHLYELRQSIAVASTRQVSPDGILLTPDSIPLHVKNRIRRYKRY